MAYRLATSGAKSVSLPSASHSQDVGGYDLLFLAEGVELSCRCEQQRRVVESYEDHVPNPSLLERSGGFGLVGQRGGSVSRRADAQPNRN
jgi:hypothetical protein